MKHQVIIFKDEHKYLLRYMGGNEKNLFLVLIEIGKSEDYNLSLIETLHLIRKISRSIQNKGHEKSVSFKLPLPTEDYRNAG